MSGAFALDRSHAHALPGGLVSRLTTRLFGLGAKIETARLLAGLGRIDPEPWQDRPSRPATARLRPDAAAA